MKLTWTPSLAIGHELIDSQHIQIFGHFDEFAEGCANGRAKETLILLHGKLKEYADTHFREEEEIMQTSNYPEIEEHKREHRVFQKDIMRLAKEIKAENVTIMDIIQTNKFLVSWLTKHVQERDQSFGEFLRTSATGQ